MKFIDLQINGAFGVDFNSDSLTSEKFELACNQLQSIGVAGFLPTIITDSMDAMCGRIRRIVAALDEFPKCKECILGIHVEGPFLSPSPGFYGTHPRQHIQQANVTAAQRLLDAGAGWVRLVTIAPEHDPGFEVIGRFVKQGVQVFAGHCDPPLEVLQRSVQAGLSGFTHLGNGCSHQVDRQDNIMQRVLACRNDLVITLIADGIHLPLWLVESWIDIFGLEKCIIISDSISAAGMGPGEYSIGDQKIRVDESRRTHNMHHGYLAGSASTMADMHRILVRDQAFEPEALRKLMHDNALKLVQSALP
jgi:N-acetylglucosamine-6-phosphate deacetylase